MLRNIPNASLSAKSLLTLMVGAALKADIRHWWHATPGGGSYAGELVDALFINLLSSISSLMQMPNALRQLIFDAIILIMRSPTVTRGRADLHSGIYHGFD
jgi:hypothetical protein